MPKLSLKMGHKEENVNHYSGYIEWNVACPKREVPSFWSQEEEYRVRR